MIIILIVFYAVFSIGFYVDLYPGAPISVPFRSDEQRLTRQMPNGLYESFILHGVDINSVVAGKQTSQFPADEKDYLRWFGYISEMGANALRVNTVMNTGF